LFDFSDISWSVLKIKFISNYLFIVGDGGRPQRRQEDLGEPEQAPDKSLAKI
jgi:hypothetical protein